jgi:hypothetical protein
MVVVRTRIATVALRYNFAHANPGALSFFEVASRDHGQGTRRVLRRDRLIVAGVVFA